MFWISVFRRYVSETFALLGG